MLRRNVADEGTICCRLNVGGNTKLIELTGKLQLVGFEAVYKFFGKAVHVRVKFLYVHM